MAHTSLERAHSPTALTYQDLYRASALERINMARSGIPVDLARKYLTGLPLAQRDIARALALKSWTTRKTSTKRSLSTAESERLIGFARLVGQLQAMVADVEGAENFDAVAWLSRWLTEPVPALGGRKPIEFLDTMEGQALVSSLLNQIHGGAYA